jgi:hypothetical protein
VPDPKPYRSNGQYNEPEPKVMSWMKVPAPVAYDSFNGEYPGAF